MVYLKRLLDIILGLYIGGVLAVIIVVLAALFLSGCGLTAADIGEVGSTFAVETAIVNSF